MKRTEKNNNGITELVFILDRSGSMSGLESDTIGGFNSMIERQKKDEGKVYVSTVLFNHTSTVIHDRADISEIREMTDRDYVPSGSTALLDAIGDSIRHIRNIHKYARPEDVPEHTMFIITTDGMENSSSRYTYDKIKSMISKRKEKNNWEFLFVGANIDAVSVASQVGISAERTANYCSDGRGTKKVFEALASPITDMRCGKAIDRVWAEEIEADLASR